MSVKFSKQQLFQHQHHQVLKLLTCLRCDKLYHCTVNQISQSCFSLHRQLTELSYQQHIKEILTEQIAIATAVEHISLQTDNTCLNVHVTHKGTYLTTISLFVPFVSLLQVRYFNFTQFQD